MAKNLKLNVKNAQLAAVLKQNKLKKGRKSSSDKEAAEGEPEKPKKTIVKAKKLAPIVRSKEEPFKEKEEAEKHPPAEETKKITQEEPTEEIARVVKKQPESAKPPEKVAIDNESSVKKLPKTEKEKQESSAESESSKKEKKKGKKEAKQEKDTSSSGEGYSPDGKRGKKAVPTHRRQAFSRVFDSRDRNRLAEEESWRRRRFGKNKTKKTMETVIRPKELTVKIPVQLKDLAAQLKVKAAEVIQKLFKQGLIITINDYLDDPTTIELIGHEFECDITIDTSQEERLQVTGESIEEEISKEDPAKLQKRPPIVTVMGHVDHGKTSIIDAFRKSQLASGEAGAITQHIGAFTCKTDHGGFTVLDTPGHEAFTAIRSRGASATDIVVLVIAGDEGIKPQTEEAIEQAKKAGVPMIIAINKMDKEGFSPDNIYRELSERDILVEAWGGDVISVNCSAKTGEGIASLGEMIALQTDVLELKANPDKRARGVVLESELHKGLGSTATLLVQNGTLRKGDALLFEYEYGRVKTMQDEHSKFLEKALPSTAVSVTGLSGVPLAGQEFLVVESEKEARKIAEARKSENQKLMLRQSRRKNLDTLLEQNAAQKEKKILNIILKADVGGSVEAIKNSLKNIPTDKVDLNFIRTDVGQIAESDIELAEASNAIIVGFHTKVESHAEGMIKQKKIKVFLHDVIYHLIDDVKEHMRSLLDKLRQENDSGEAKVLATFKSSQLGVIAGCQVMSGIVKRGQLARVFRGDEMLWEGTLSSLKRHKDDVKEVKKDLECGIVLHGFSAFAADDVIKTYEITYIEQEL